MNTSPLATRVAGLLLLSLATLPLTSCGDETSPQGATISAPGDLTVTYSGVVADVPDSWNVPLEFQVLDADGNPAPGVTIRFFGYGMITQLADRADPLTAVPLDASNPIFFETTTNDQGLPPKDIFAHWLVVACAAPVDIATTGNVVATVGAASAEWKVDITTDCTP